MKYSLDVYAQWKHELPVEEFAKLIDERDQLQQELAELKAKLLTVEQKNK